MKSQIFYTDKYKEIEKAITTMINSQEDFLSPQTAPSTRAVGDAIQSIVSENLPSLLGDMCENYSADFARRAMADAAFTDKDGFYYRIDVKTHRIGTHFNMPNLTSARRLAHFYEDDRNYFVILMLEYDIKETHIEALKSYFVPIEFLSWSCLTVGALGWGQIQIANANNINIIPGYQRSKWMLELCDVMLDFYGREIGKIHERIDYFKKVRRRWQNRKA